MAKGQNTTPEIVEKIKLCKATGMTDPETARACGGIPTNTVYTVMKRIKSDPKQAEEFERLKARKKKELQEKAEKDFDKTMKVKLENLFNRSVEVINEAIDNQQLTPRDAVTIMGTTFDKRQVLTGGKTANIGVSYEEILREIQKGDEY